ncbi:MAG: GNAT family N-acetyltransferase [Ruegeria sp.]
MTVLIRPARSTDAGSTGTILHGFARENDWMPELHSTAETIAFCGKMIDREWVTVAENENGVIGFLALDGQTIHSLYLDKSIRGQGIGKQLLAHAKSKHAKLSLFAFQANKGARRFYERNGFVAVERSDGANNDEKLPDVKYAWQVEGTSYG